MPPFPRAPTVPSRNKATSSTFSTSDSNHVHTCSINSRTTARRKDSTKALLELAEAAYQRAAAREAAATAGDDQGSQALGLHEAVVAFRQAGEAASAACEEARRDFSKMTGAVARRGAKEDLARDLVWGSLAVAATIVLGDGD